MTHAHTLTYEHTHKPISTRERRGQRRSERTMTQPEPDPCFSLIFSNLFDFVRERGGWERQRERERQNEKKGKREGGREGRERVRGKSRKEGREEGRKEGREKEEGRERERAQMRESARR